jgi:predicted dehydrogenase
MATLRFGILSTADIAIKKVIPGMRRSALGDVVAIASRDGDRAAAVARDMGIPRSHGSYEALLADPDVDAVYIPLPNHLHAEWAIAAVGAGKHVLCEKPMAMTAVDAQRMADAAEAAGVHLMEAFMYRHHPSWVAALELVAAGRIGPVRAVHSWFSYFNDDQANIRNIRAIGGGALYDIGCYNVSLSRLLFGAEPTEVVADLERDPIGDTDVRTSALLRFPSTALMAASASRSRSTSRPTARPASTWCTAGSRRWIRPRRHSPSKRRIPTRPRSTPSRAPSWTAARRRSRPRTRWPTCASSSASSRPPNPAEGRRSPVGDR